MNERRIITALGGAVVAALLVAGCSHSNGNAVESAQQNASTNLLVTNQPVPIFPTSAMRGEMIEIEAIQALGAPTTVFFYPEGSSPGAHVAPIKSCPAEGEPIPNTASLSNPNQMLTKSGVDGGVTGGQMDPNGLYVPQSSSGTYVLCVTSSGNVALSYWEGPVEAESGAAVYDATTGQIQDIGPSALPVCTVKHSSSGQFAGLPAGTPYYHCVLPPGVRQPKGTSAG